MKETKAIMGVVHSISPPALDVMKKVMDLIRAEIVTLDKTNDRKSQDLLMIGLMLVHEVAVREMVNPDIVASVRSAVHDVLEEFGRE